jgi:hypothetical protein
MKGPALIAIAVLFGAGAALAEETTIIRRDKPADVTIEKRSVETTGTLATECKSKTVQKQNEFGETKTVHKEKCE